MHAEVDTSFRPVHLVLETQEEVDAVASILNHVKILDAAEHFFGVRVFNYHFCSLRSEHAKDLWSMFDNTLRDSLR